MAAIFGREKFFKIAEYIVQEYNFDEIALSHTVKEIEANSCFAILGKNSKIQNGRHFWGGENFFKNCQEYIAQIPCGLKISMKSLYLARLRR